MIATFGMNSVVVGEKRVRCSGLTGRIGDIGGGLQKPSIFDVSKMTLGDCMRGGGRDS